MRFKAKTAIVTGGGSGIGEAIAIRLAEEGADVAIHDLDEQAAEATADKIRQLGRKGLAIPTDVADAEQVRRSIALTLEVFGHIDIVVNNAGINLYKFAGEFTDEEWLRIIAVNLHGVWYYCRHVLDHFLERGRGNIVNIASVGAFQTSFNRVPYMASKGGVVSMTKALATDLASRNIRVNAVAPGLTETGMTHWRSTGDQRELGNYLTPMGRWGLPREVADAVLFLASEESSYITGHILCVDGGLLAGNPIGKGPFPPGSKGSNDPCRS
jgi:NAD(P)-dependent dehydrogenase (short-subunit alcohol dehydrogenase family)